MPKINEKLYIESKTNNTVEDCCIYSTSSDAYGDERMYASVNGTTCYIPLTLSTSSPYASKGRVIKNGKNYAIKRSSVPYDYCLYSIDTPWHLVYTRADENCGIAGHTHDESGYNESKTICEVYNGKSESLILTSGSGTFTVPADVYYIKVTCVGGGAGGINYSDRCLESIDDDDDGNVESWIYNKKNFTRTISAVGGGKTMFNKDKNVLVSADGATAPSLNFSSTILSDSCYHERTVNEGDDVIKEYYPCRPLVSVTNSIGSINGIYKPSTSSTYYPTNADGTPNYGVQVKTIDGDLLCYAGGGGKADGRAEVIFTGGVGKMKSECLKVNPGETYTITIGKRGVGYDDDTIVNKGYRHKNDSDDGASSGTEGCILIEWGEGIE